MQTSIFCSACGGRTHEEADACSSCGKSDGEVRQTVGEARTRYCPDRGTTLADLPAWALEGLTFCRKGEGGTLIASVPLGEIQRSS